MCFIGWNNFNTYELFFVIVGLFIRKRGYDEFLTQRDILSHPSIEDDQNGGRLIIYDFLKSYTGLDGKNLPRTIVPCGKRLDLSHYSYGFNEIVARSLERESVKAYNDLDRALVDKLMISSPECVKLRDLILRFGGDEKCKKEK